MAYLKEYIPDNDGKFDKFWEFMNRYVGQKCGGNRPEWTHIPPEALSKMNEAYAVWAAAYAGIVGPHTPVDTEAKNNAKKAGKKVIRAFVNQYLRFPPVTDEDRTAMGVPNRDTTRTPVGVPKTKPVFNIEIKGIRSVTIPFRDEGTESHAIPTGFGGAVVSWDPSDTPIKDPKKLTRSELATRSPHVLTFEEEDRGKIVYVSLQWQNKKGQKGDFSAIQMAIIP
jgi:hypothetical protein